KRQTLEEFYAELENSPESHTREIGAGMRKLLAVLPSVLSGVRAWGLTSHYHLILCSQDDYQSEHYVMITCFPGDRYDIEYRMPTNFAPWQGAWVKGYDRRLPDAVA